MTGQILHWGSVLLLQSFPHYVNWALDWTKCLNSAPFSDTHSLLSGRKWSFMYIVVYLVANTSLKALVNPSLLSALLCCRLHSISNTDGNWLPSIFSSHSHLKQQQNICHSKLIRLVTFAQYPSRTTSFQNVTSILRASSSSELDSTLTLDKGSPNITLVLKTVEMMKREMLRALGAKYALSFNN